MVLPTEKNENKLKRTSRIRLSLRSIFVLLILNAFAFAWLSWKIRDAGVRDSFARKVVQQGGSVAYSNQFDGNNSRLTPYPKTDTIIDKSIAKIFGTNPFQTLRFVALGQDFELSELQAYSLQDEIHILIVRHSSFNDASLAKITSCRQLQFLDLQQTTIADIGIESIPRFKHLEQLWLQGTNVSDAGMITLSAVPTLQILDVRGTKITSAGIAQVAKMPNMNLLYLDGRQCSPEAIASLRETMNLSMVWIELNEVSNFGLESLKSTPSIRDLTLTGKGVNDDLIRSLQGNQHILAIQIFRCDEITDDSIDVLLELPKLERLNLAGAVKLSSEAMAKVAKRFR